MNRKERRGVKKRLSETMPQNRQCGACTACCTLTDIPEIGKPAGTRCVHERNAPEPPGCAIHARSPLDCRNYRCAWLHGFGSADERPDKVGYVLNIADNSSRVEWHRLPVHERIQTAWLVTHDIVEGSGASKAAMGRLSGYNAVLIMPDGIVVGPDQKAMVAAYEARARRTLPVVKE